MQFPCVCPCHLQTANTVMETSSIKEPSICVCVPLSPPNLLPSVFTVMVPTTVCRLGVCVCVCWLVMALTHVALFVHRLDCFLALPVQTAPHYHSLWCVCVCVSGVEVPLAFVCLTLVALVPPWWRWTKTVVSAVTKAASLYLSLTLSPLAVLPLFSHAHAAW